MWIWRCCRFHRALETWNKATLFNSRLLGGGESQPLAGGKNVIALEPSRQDNERIDLHETLQEVRGCLHSSFFSLSERRACVISKFEKQQSAPVNNSNQVRALVVCV